MACGYECMRRVQRHPWLATLILFLAIASLGSVTPWGPAPSGSTTVSLPYSAFLAQVTANNVTTAQIASDTISGAFKTPYTDPATDASYDGYTTRLLPVSDPALVPLLLRHHVQVTAADPGSPIWNTALGWLVDIVPFIFLLGLLYWLMKSGRQRQQGLFGIGQSKAKLYTRERPSTTFADVAGVEAAKAELSEEVDFLRDPSKYRRLGAKIPKGVLLVGPPGTGKTLLARAVAGEAHVPFFSISATEFVEVFVGVGASRVRDLFEKAKVAAPAIIFIDEIDAIGRQRGGGRLGGGANDEREQTLNQLLVCMDGFEPNQAVIVLAATNRPDVLDHALLRPGRFDRQVTVDPPDRKGREAVLAVHMRNIPLSPAVDLGALAQATPGMSGADLANLANEAALNAARKNEQAVTPRDFDEALDRIVLGAAGAALMNEDERRTVAYHEAGHALVACLLPHADPVHRVTITPRGRSLGVTQFRPLDDRRNYRRDYLLERMAMSLGGRASEEIACEEITSGAQNDLQQATRMARAMVTQLGMADEVGPAYFGGGSDDALNGHGYNPWEPKDYSEETAKRIDEAVQRLIDEAHACARRLLCENRAALEAIAHALYADESLSREELLALVTAHCAPGAGHPLVPPAAAHTDAGRADAAAMYPDSAAAAATASR